MHRDDTGASLVIALIFVVVMSLVIIAIVNLSGTNLINTANLETDRALTYAADGTIDTAIQVARYQSPVTACSDSQSFAVPSLETDLGVSVVVYCEAGGPVGFRQATFVACAPGLGFLTCAGTDASPGPYVTKAVVQYGDSPTTGSTVSVQSWIVNSANG